jgi:hypothetical protein
MIAGILALFYDDIERLAKKYSDGVAAMQGSTGASLTPEQKKYSRRR